MRRLLVLFFLLNFFAACNWKSAPDGVIAEDRMVNLLVDMHLADAYTATLVDTPQIISAYKSVYKTNETDSLTFRKSLEYYTRDPQQLQDIYARVNEKLATMQKSAQKIEQKRLKEQQKREKKFADSLKKVEKRFRDSLKRDSIKKVKVKKDLLKRDSLKLDSIRKAKLSIKKRDSLKKDSVKKARLEKLRQRIKNNGIPPKRN